MSLRACAKRRFPSWLAKGYTAARTRFMVWNRRERKNTNTNLNGTRHAGVRTKLRAQIRINGSATSSTRNRRTSNWYRLTVILFHLLNLFIHKLRDWGHTQHSEERKKEKNNSTLSTPDELVWSVRHVVVCADCGLHEAIAKVVRSRESSKWQLYKLTHTHSVPVVGMHSTTLENWIKRKNVMRCTCTVHN